MEARKFTTRRLGGACAAMLLAVALPVFAQVYLPPPPPVVHMPDLIWHQFTMNQMRSNALASSMFLDSMIKDMNGLASKAGNSRDAGAAFDAGATLLQGAEVPALPPGAASALAFEPSGRSLLAEKIAAEDPTQDPAQLEQFFTRLYEDYLRAFSEEHERLGMPQHDVAAAFTSYVIFSYLDAHGLSAIEAETSLAVYRQSVGVLLGNEQLATLAPRDRELLAETFVVLGATPRLLFEETRDPAQRQQAGLANLTRIFGPDASTLRLTPAGIQR